MDSERFLFGIIGIIAAGENLMMLSAICNRCRQGLQVVQIVFLDKGYSGRYQRKKALHRCIVLREL